MTEEEYVLVENLVKLSAAKHFIDDCLPEYGITFQEKVLLSSKLDTIIAKMRLDIAIQTIVVDSVEIANEIMKKLRGQYEILCCTNAWEMYSCRNS